VTETSTAAAVTAEDLRRPLGRDATFLQLSSGFCAPCRATRRVLERVVATQDGVAHVEVDVAHRADLAERFGVVETPTTVLLDADGAPALRVTGVPSLAQARAAVAALRAGS
jgi:thioredoxin-like negative regulator of GroEL